MFYRRRRLKQKLRDSTGIDINNEQAVERWTRKLGVTAEQLIAAVTAVGAANARDYLEKQRKSAGRERR